MSKRNVPPSKSIHDRQFIYYTALGATATVLPGCAIPRTGRVSPNERLNIAGVGCGGKGTSDLSFCAAENIVALCDVNETHAAATRQKFPQAKFYNDFPVMLG